MNRVYPAHSVPDALNVTGLFILNRFRDMTREEVIAMLNFDIMDTVAGRQIYDEEMKKGVKKGHIETLTDVLRERLPCNDGANPG